jgi:hypothetical protein
MRCRNKLWKQSKNKNKCGDIKVFDRYGKLIETITILTAPPPVDLITPAEQNERDNDRYREWREAIIARDKNKCVLCQSSEFLQAHHIERWIDNKERRYDLKNGVTLCYHCHMRHHGQYRAAFKPEITAMLIGYIKSIYRSKNG